MSYSEIQYCKDMIVFYYSCIEKLRQPDGGFRLCDMDVIERLYNSIDYFREELKRIVREESNE